MVRRNGSKRRTGGSLLEFALVFPVTFLLTAGLIIGASGIFRYQEVARLAREGARYASVRGSQYQSEKSKPALTRDDVKNNAVLPGAVMLDSSLLDTNATWSNTDHTAGKSTVTVTVTYQWFPELYVTGPITLTSTSTMLITY